MDKNSRPVKSLLSLCFEYPLSQKAQKVPSMSNEFDFRKKTEKLYQCTPSNRVNSDHEFDDRGPPTDMNSKPQHDLDCSSLSSKVQSVFMASGRPHAAGSTAATNNSRYSQELPVTKSMACSYQTMEKQYDSDTWKMYQRIHLSRCEFSSSKHPQQFVETQKPFTLPAICNKEEREEVFHDDTDEVSSESIRDQEDTCNLEQVDCYYSDAIFDLEC